MHAIPIAVAGDHEPASATADTLGLSGPWDGLRRHVRNDIPRDFSRGIDGARPPVAADEREARRQRSALTLASTRAAAEFERWTRVPPLRAAASVTGA